MKLTDEQQAIADIDLGSIPGARIIAFAGTCKTTALKYLAEANAGKRILYLVFNNWLGDIAASGSPLQKRGMANTCTEA